MGWGTILVYTNFKRHVFGHLLDFNNVYDNLIYVWCITASDPQNIVLDPQFLSLNPLIIASSENDTVWVKSIFWTLISLVWRKYLTSQQEEGEEDMDYLANDEDVADDDAGDEDDDYDEENDDDGDDGNHLTSQ